MLPRPILSCLECRRKKLKCNRSLPNCDQCQKRRTTARCAYDAHELEPNDVGKGSQSSPNARKKAKVDSSPGPGIASGNSDTNSSGARLGIVEDLQARVGRLERLLTAKRHCPTKGQHDLECKTPGMLTIKGTGSRYHAMDQKIPMFFRVSAEFRAPSSTNTSSSTKLYTSFTNYLTILPWIPRRGNSQCGERQL